MDRLGIAQISNQEKGFGWKKGATK